MSLKKILLSALLFVSFHIYSQDKFVAGYFIDNNDKKTECLIQNLDWLNNPTKFNYKLTNAEIVKEATISFVKEFGAENAFIYKRLTVKIERSSSLTRDLDSDRGFKFQEETLFLKPLVVGKAVLYSYEDVNLRKYFYSVNDSEVKQLLYKSYMIDGSIGENETFKKDLWRDLKSDKLSDNDFKNVRYSQRSLTDLFVKYNGVYGIENAIVENYEHKKILFNLSVRPGVNMSSLSIRTVALDMYDIPKTVKFSSQVSFRLGFEAELVFPFNNNKWSVAVEPTYQYFKAEQESNTKKSSVDYKSIELPVYLRHYFFLKNESKIFINAGFETDFPVKREVVFNNINLAPDKKINFNLGVGLGYNFKRYSLEARYKPNRGILGGFGRYKSDYNTFSFIFGYKFL